MKIIRSEEKQWEEKEGYSKKIFLDEKDINHPGALVQKVKIKAGEVVKEHYHKKQTEIFYFLDSNSSWVINDKEMNFKEGDFLVLEPFEKHSVSNNTKEESTILTFKLNYIDKDLYWS